MSISSGTFRITVTYTDAIILFHHRMVTDAVARILYSGLAPTLVTECIVHAVLSRIRIRKRSQI